MLTDCEKEEWNLELQPYNEGVKYIYHINNYRLQYVLVFLHAINNKIKCCKVIFHMLAEIILREEKIWKDVN